MDSDVEMTDAPPLIEPSPCGFDDLPLEIHEKILDCVFDGWMSRPNTKITARAAETLVMNTIADLALVSRLWKQLVQSRIFRHITLVGDNDNLHTSGDFYRIRPHLAIHVRHVEIHSPEWQSMLAFDTPNTRNHLTDYYIPSAGIINHEPSAVPVMLQKTADYNSCGTLPNIFHFIHSYLPEARILTMAGGPGYGQPFFSTNPWACPDKVQLAVLPNIQTFNIRGSWNLLRSTHHWTLLSAALPSVQEWHCTSVVPKSDGYTAISHALPNIPANMRRISLQLEDLANIYSPLGMLRSRVPHLCSLIAAAAPRLDSVTVTGTLCPSIFKPPKHKPTPSSEATLKSIDLTISNTCCRERDTMVWIPGIETDISLMDFIREFETLVLGSIAWLGLYRSLQHIRIQFVDPGSPFPRFSPYFEFKDRECRGVWSDVIVAALRQARPDASYVALEDGLKLRFARNGQLLGIVYPRTRPCSIHLDMYKSFDGANVITSS